MSKRTKPVDKPYTGQFRDQDEEDRWYEGMRNAEGRDARKRPHAKPRGERLPLLALMAG